MKTLFIMAVLFLTSCGLAPKTYQIVSPEEAKISEYLPPFDKCYWEEEYQYSVKYCNGTEVARCSELGCYYRTKEVVDIQNDRIMQLRESDIETEYRLMRKRQVREIKENTMAHEKANRRVWRGY